MQGLTVQGGFNVTGGRASVNDVALVAYGGLNVKDCGAVGDGVADDTAAILRALGGSRTGSGGSVEVFFPAGRYNFSQPLVIDGNTSVRGVGCRPYNQGGSELRYTGAAANAVTLGATGADWSNSKFVGMRITTGLSLASGRGLVVYNPTNNSEVRDVLVSGFTDGQILIGDGSGGSGGGTHPGPNFFRLSNFFVTGGIAPLEVQGGRQQCLIDYGGIDLTATSLQGFLQTGGEALSQVTMMQSVKVEGSFDVPGFKHAGLGSTMFIGCHRFNGGAALTSAGPAFLFDVPAQQDCHMSILGCGAIGCVVGVGAPGRGVSMTIGSAGGFIPWFFVGGGGGSGAVSSMFAPSNATYKFVVLHDQVQLAWTTAGDPLTVDTNLYRSAANVLKTDDTLHAVLGVATMVKAGTPTDADWAVAPPVGTLVVDTTGNKIWTRTAAATWKSVAVA